MRESRSLIAATIAAHAGLFLLISFLLVVSFCIVFGVAVVGFAKFAEAQHPGSLRGPLVAAAPMLAAAFTTVLLHIVVLAVLAYLRVPLTKFFLLLISVGAVSLIAVWYINLGVLQWTMGWYPVLGTPVREYPVLVMTPGQPAGHYRAQVVQWTDLEKFRRENPQFTFLVPEGQESDLHSQMPSHDFKWSIAENRNREEPVSARFEVTRMSNGRQKLIVRGSWYRNSNASVESWYEVEGQKIHPKYFIEGDTWGYYMRNVFLLVGSIDLALLAFYLRRKWKASFRAIENQSA